MLCQRCQTEYTRMAGVQRFKRDYGYCSIACLELSKPPCPTCGTPIVYDGRMRIGKFAKQCYCSQHCAAVAVGAAAIADGRMGHIHTLTDWQAPERRAKLRATWQRKKIDGSAERINRARAEGNRLWRAEHPDAVQAMIATQEASRRGRGRHQEASKRMKAFFQSPEGDTMKAHLRSLHIGKPRPPLVTAKMKATLRQFWSSPQGLVLREQISLKRTNGLPDTPYGPGWVRQATKIRQRDGCCVLCGITREQVRRVLDVHHIKPRRSFGYIPGQNVNYRWANHPANLVTLCQTCHRKVELKVVPLPVDYAERAEALWAEFIRQKPSS